MLKHASFAIIAASRAGGATRTFRKEAHRADFSHVKKQPGYIYVRSRAISSRANDNHDLFPADEIKAAYQTFLGKPVFVNHHNENHKRARGVIKAVALHEDVNPDGTDDTWVEVLMEVDAVRFPKLADAILDGDIDRTSMGTDVRLSRCSACGNEAETPLDYCSHIKHHKGQTLRRVNPHTGKHEDVKIVEICTGLSFFENSLLVEDPADPTAAFLGVELFEEGDHPSSKVATRERPVRSDWSQSWKRGDFISWESPDGWKMGEITRTSGPKTVSHAREWGKSSGEPVDGAVKLMPNHFFSQQSTAEMVASYPGPFPTEQEAAHWAKKYLSTVRNDADYGQTFTSWDWGYSDRVDKRKLAKVARRQDPSLEGTALLAEFHWLKSAKTVDKDDVATMIDVLAGLLQDSEYSNVDDLCKVSVPGTNLFCDQSKNVPRSQMPQLSDGSKDITDDFKKHLREELGKSVTETSERAANLKATQNQLNGKKVAGMVQAIKSGSMKDEAIMVSSDNYIVDGHHRWAAKVAYDLLDAKLGDVSMPVTKVNMPILDLIKEANDFAQANGIAQRGLYAKLLVSRLHKQANYGLLWQSSTGIVHRSLNCPHLPSSERAQVLPADSVIEDRVVKSFGVKACSTCFPLAPGRRKTAASGVMLAKQMRVGDVLLQMGNPFGTITRIEENVPVKVGPSGDIYGYRMHLDLAAGGTFTVSMAPDDQWAVQDAGSRRDLTPPPAPSPNPKVTLYCSLCSRDFYVADRGPGQRLPRHNFSASSGTPCDGSGKTVDETYAMQRDLMARQRWGSTTKIAGWRQIENTNEWSFELPNHPKALSAWVGIVDGAWWWEVESIDLDTGIVRLEDVGGPVPNVERAMYLGERTLDRLAPVLASRRHAEKATKVPSTVDTLRDETCPVCGDSQGFSGEQCQVCGYHKVPSEFLDPDLNKAREVADHQAEVDAQVNEGSLQCDECGELADGKGDTDEAAPDEADGDEADGEGSGLERFKESSLDHDGDDPADDEQLPARWYQDGDSCPKCGRGTLHPVGGDASPTETS